jgi:ferric-dicitrate binding protein FerR (iron transport regulator)
MDAVVTEALLLNYFAGGASALQKQLIDHWIREPDNQEFFYAVLERWENQHPQYVADTQAARERHQRRLLSHISSDAATVAVSSERVGFLVRSNWLRIVFAAATIVLITGWIGRDQILYKTYTTAYGTISHLVLADGSKVTLNANSSLKEPRFDFGQSARTVQLTGEADFTVTHTTDNRQFIVHTERGLDVIVLGTEFTVYSRQPGDRVVLRKGQVKLLYPESAAARSVIMKPGDLINVDRKGYVQSRTIRQPEQYAAWRSHRIVFDQTTMPEVAGLTLVIADTDVANWTITGAFTAQSAEELLDALSQASGLTYRQYDKTVTLSLLTTKQ